MTVVTGGWPVRILADSNFTLFADGKKIGSGVYNDMKEIYRYRVDPQSKVFAVKVDGRGENRAGFIASIGSSIVSSSTWKCNGSADDNVVAWRSREPTTQIGRKRWRWARTRVKAQHPGALSQVWHRRRFGYTHDAYIEKSSAICRVDTTMHGIATAKTFGCLRWSCKSLRNRESFSVSLNARKIAMATRSGQTILRWHKKFSPYQFRDELF